MGLGHIEALIMVYKCMKFHEICFSTFKVIAKVKVLTTTTPTPTAPESDDNTSTFNLCKTAELKRRPMTTM